MTNRRLTDKAEADARAYFASQPKRYCPNCGKNASRGSFCAICVESRRISRENDVRNFRVEQRLKERVRLDEEVKQQLGNGRRNEQATN